MSTQNAQDLEVAGNLREERIIRMYFGFKEGNPHTLEEVGQTFAVTRERICKIEIKALTLRHRHVSDSSAPFSRATCDAGSFV